MRIAIVSASLSESSSTQQLGQAIGDAVAAELGGQIVHVSLRELAHAMTDNLLTGFPSQALESAFDEVAHADVVIAVTPTYNASYSGLFKTFFDVLPDGALRDKPVAIGATGGTPRHSLVTEHAIRPMFTYLHAITAPTAVFAATEDFGAHASDSDPSGGSSLTGRIRRLAKELAASVGGSSSSERGTPEAEQATVADRSTPDVDAARELFDDFKSMDELFG